MEYGLSGLRVCDMLLGVPIALQTYSTTSTIPLRPAIVSPSPSPPPSHPPGQAAHEYKSNIWVAIEVMQSWLLPHIRRERKTERAETGTMRCTIAAYIVEYYRCVSLGGDMGSFTRLVTVQVHLGKSVESDICIYSYCVGCFDFAIACSQWLHPARQRTYIQLTNTKLWSLGARTGGKRPS